MIRAFDLGLSQANSVSTSGVSHELGDELLPRAECFEPDLQRVLFRSTSTQHERLFTYSQFLKEVPQSMTEGTLLYILALVTASALYICRKLVKTSHGDTVDANLMQDGIWTLDQEFDLAQTQFNLTTIDDQPVFEVRTEENERRFSSDGRANLQVLCEACRSAYGRLQSESRPMTAPSSLTKSVSATSDQARGTSVTTSSPQIVRNAAGEIIQGTLTGLVRHLLLEKADSSNMNKLSEILLQTIGLWASAEAFLVEVCAQLDILADTATKGRPGFIVRTLLSAAASLLLDSKIVEALLKLVDFTDFEERQALKDDLWQKRTHLLSVIAMDLQSERSSTRTVIDSGDLLEAEWHNLSRSGLLAESVLTIPAQLFASQLHIFHQYYLRKWDPSRDKSLFFNSDYRGSSRNPLVFSQHKMHFLTHTILSHILCVEALPISTSHRAAICAQWIKIGVILKKSGDMTGYIACVMALCAPAITRLREMWSLVDERLRVMVEKEWSAVMCDLFRRTLEPRRRDILPAHVLFPDVTTHGCDASDIVPFYGDICDAVEDTRRRLKDSSSEEISIDLATTRKGRQLVTFALEDYLQFLENSSRQGDHLDAIETIKPHVNSDFQDCFRQLNSMPTETTNVCSQVFLEASINCEPVREDNLSEQKRILESGISTEAFVPLLFTDQLPCYRLFDLSNLLELNESGKRTKVNNTMSSSRFSHASDAAVSGVSMRRLNSFPPTRLPASYTTGHSHLDETTRQRTAASVSQWKMLKHVRDLTGVSEKLLCLANGDLILREAEIDSSSNRKRPQSFLVDPRKRDSVMSRRSSMQIPDSTIIDSEEDLIIRPQKCSSRKNGTKEFVIKAATFERMIDLLVLELNDFRGLNVGLSIDAHKSLESVSIDRPQYLSIFLTSYRSYCNSAQLLQALIARMRKAIMACKSDPASIDSIFPSWDIAYDWTPKTVDWVLVEKLFKGIFEVLSTWIALSASDVWSSGTLVVALSQFFEAAEEQMSTLEICGNYNELAYVCYRRCTSNLKSLRKQLLRTQHRPQYWHQPYSLDQDWSRHERYNIPPQANNEDAHEVILNMDKLMQIVIHSVRLGDWMICYELLDAQCAEPRKLYNNITELVSIDQDIPIRDSLNFLESTTQNGGQGSLLDRLPMPIRRLFHLRSSITSWTIGQIVDAGIDIDERVARIKFLLTLVRVSCSNMSPFDIEISGTSGKIDKKQIVPSLIASAISAGLVSPESRSFLLSWTFVLQASKNVDCLRTVYDLLPPTPEDLQQSHPNVACPVWLVDRMLEIVCYIPDSSAHDSQLANLEKRRYIYDLLQNLEMHGPYPERVNVALDSADPFLFLLNTNPQQIDWKIVRRLAHKENSSMRNMRIHRPFPHIVQREQDKARRDIKCRDAVERVSRDLQKTSMKKRHETNRMTESSRKSGSRSKYGMNSLLRAVRPISVAIAGNWTPDKHHGLVRVVAPADLPEKCSIPRGTKPSITLDLVNSNVVIYNRKDNIFRIRTEDGLETFFQTPSHDELDSWVQETSRAAKEGTTKRRNTIKEDARLAAIDEAPQFSPRNSVVVDIKTAIFGIDLPLLVRREGSSIPRIAIALIQEVERRGLSEVGIYRISGTLSTVNALKRLFDSGANINLGDPVWEDINAVAGVFKLWLRELPEPLMTYGLYDKFLDTLNIEDYTTRSLSLKELVHQLPVPNFSMLKRLIEHLERITDYEVTNHMYAHNLAIVFGPNILQPPQSSRSIVTSMNDLGKIQTLVRNLILQCHWIFATDDEAEEAAFRRSGDILSQIEELSVSETNHL